MTDQPPEVRLCVLLACFAGRRGASKVRRTLGKRIRDQGDAILDEFVVGVDAKHGIHTYDPRRAAAGALTSALTWGLFGLVVGGLQGLGVWAVLGALSGGLFAMFSLHRFTKDERTRIGEHLRADSSAVTFFLNGSDPERILASTGPFGPEVASVLAVASDLSARVFLASGDPVDSTVEPAPTSAPVTVLTMLLLRYSGEYSARQALAGVGAPKKGSDTDAPRAELVVEEDKRGKRRVIDPTMGAAAGSKSDVVSWGAFGLVYGLIVGLAGNGGVLNGVERGAVTAIAWGVFGLGAGALFGLWSGRSVSARRLKGIGPLVPPDSSITLAWAGGTASASTIGDWLPSASQRLLVHFVSEERGLLMKVATR